MKSARITYALVISLFLSGAPWSIPGEQGEFAAATPPHSALPAERLKPGIELVVRGEYQAARRYAKEQMSRDELTGKFLLAALLQARMGELETAENRMEFSTVADEVITGARIRLGKNPGDAAARFYLGAVQGFKAVILAREGSYLNAFIAARSGIHELTRCTVSNPGCFEAHIFLNVYRYWRSAKNFLRFFPGIPDERCEALQELSENLDPSSPGYALGLHQLVWMQYDFGDMESAAETARSGLRKYPESRFFLYPAGVVSARQDRWLDAAAFFEQTARSLENDGLNDRYFWFKVVVKQVESLLRTDRHGEAGALAAKVLEAPVATADRKRVKPLVDRIRRMNFGDVDRLEMHLQPDGEPGAIHR